MKKLLSKGSTESLHEELQENCLEMIDECQSPAHNAGFFVENNYKIYTIDIVSLKILVYKHKGNTMSAHDLRFFGVVGVCVLCTIGMLVIIAYQIEYLLKNGKEGKNAKERQTLGVHNRILHRFGATNTIYICASCHAQISCVAVFCPHCGKDPGYKPPRPPALSC